MLIHTFPPRRMCRVIAIRADSICRFVTYAGSSAWMPYSPKLTRVAPLAAPERSGWCCLRCLTLRGTSMASALPSLGAGTGGRCVGSLGDRRLGGGATGIGARAGAAGRAGPARASRPVAALTALTAVAALTTVAALPALLLAQRGFGDLPLAWPAQHVALVDPDLDADPAERRAGLVHPVVDVRPQRVQRHPTLAVELRPGHLRSAQPAGALHPDALYSRALQRRLHGLAHGPAEAHPARQLLGHALRDQLRVRLGVLHLENVELHLLAGELLQLG